MVMPLPGAEVDDCDISSDGIFPSSQYFIWSLRGCVIIEEVGSFRSCFVFGFGSACFG